MKVYGLVSGVEGALGRQLKGLGSIMGWQGTHRCGEVGVGVQGFRG